MRLTSNRQLRLAALLRLHPTAGASIPYGESVTCHLNFVNDCQYSSMH